MQFTIFYIENETNITTDSLFLITIPIDDEREKLVHSIKYCIIVVTEYQKPKQNKKPTKQVNDAIQKDLYYEL